MKIPMALLVLSLMSASCIKFEGQLNVKQVLTAKKKGFLHLRKKTVQIEPGSYQASLKVNDKKSFTLKLNKDGECDTLIPIKTKKELLIPTNGNIIIKGSDIGQPFDLSADIETKVTETDKIKTYETCFVQRTERFCDRVYDGRFPTPIGHYDPTPIGGYGGYDGHCRERTVTFEGTRFVEYHNRFTQRNLKADLLSTENKDVLATFTGYDSDTDQIVDFMGECR